jgi:hypothetical protein
MDSSPSNADWFKPNFGLKNSLMLYINCCISKSESFGPSNLVASENVNPISENLLRTRLLFVMSEVGGVRGGGGCSAAIPSISRTETPTICTSFCRIRKLNILDGFGCS